MTVGENGSVRWEHKRSFFGFVLGLAKNPSRILRMVVGVKSWRHSWEIKVLCHLETKQWEIARVFYVHV